MAGDWIKFELTTLDKPEVIAMADLLETSTYDVVGRLLRVWGWFDQQTRNGNAASVTGTALKRYIDTLSGSQGFAACMQKVGWLSDDGMPNFDRHNGKSAKERALTNDRVKRNRNAPAVTESLPEKRREEKINTCTPASAKRKSKATPLPADFRVSPRVRRWGLERGMSEDLLRRHCEHFTLQAAAKGYTYVDWDAALIKAISADWARLGAAVAPAAQSAARAQQVIAEQRAVASAPMPEALQRFVRRPG